MKKKRVSEYHVVSGRQNKLIILIYENFTYIIKNVYILTELSTPRGNQSNKLQNCFSG